MGSEATKGKGTVTGGDVVVYEEKGGRVRLEVRLEGETVWLSLSQMAELFGRDKSVVARHLRGVFATGELSRAATVAENATVQREGVREVTRQIEFFNLACAGTRSTSGACARRAWERWSRPWACSRAR